MTNAVMKAQNATLIECFAENHGLKPANVLPVLKETIFPKGQATDGQVQMFLAVANRYELDPFTKEVFAFPTRGGGIQAIVGVDGWSKLANGRPEFDGVEFSYEENDGAIISCTCCMYRKDRSRPIKVTEYMDECKGKTEPWTKWPRRMLRHKAYIQAARLAFGFAGIVDEDEADRMKEVGAVVVNDEPTQKQLAARDKLAGKRTSKKDTAPKEEPKTVDAVEEVVTPPETEQEPPFEPDSNEPAGDEIEARLKYIEDAKKIDAGAVSICLGRMKPETVVADDRLWTRFTAELKAKLDGEGE